MIKISTTSIFERILSRNYICSTCNITIDLFRLYPHFPALCDMRLATVKTRGLDTTILYRCINKAKFELITIIGSEKEAWCRVLYGYIWSRIWHISTYQAYRHTHILCNMPETCNYLPSFEERLTLYFSRSSPVAKSRHFQLRIYS